MSQKLRPGPPSRATRQAGTPGGKWRRTLMRPSLLSLTAAAAGFSAIVHTMTIAGATDKMPGAMQPQTRLGVSIQQSISERDQALAQRKRAIDLREQSARAAEQRLKAELQDRNAAPGGTTSEGGRKDSPEANQPIEDLAHIYQTMKPVRAAPIFAALDLDVQTQIARRMRERAIALIMANMEPGAAVRLSMALAGRRPLASLSPPAPALPVATQTSSRIASAALSAGRPSRLVPAGRRSPSAAASIPAQVKSPASRGKPVQPPQTVAIKTPKVADAAITALSGKTVPAPTSPATPGEMTGH